MSKKDERILIILKKWVTGEISTGQADRELKVAGVELPKTNTLHGNR